MSGAAVNQLGPTPIRAAIGLEGGAASGRREQFRWAVRIRWMAIAGFLVLGMIAWLAGVLVDPLPCLVAAAGASALNVWNGIAVHRWRGVAAATAAAVAGDVLLITFLVARTGGVQSPFVAMYAVQVLAAALLVEVRVALACAGGAAVALAFAVLADPRPSTAVVGATAFLPAWVAFFAFGLGLVAYVGGHVAGRLRGREQALHRSNCELRAALGSVEAGNRELRATCERLERAERQLAQSEKMRALGDFVAGVAHELNNPIAIVAANLQILGAELGDAGAEPVGEALHDCNEAAARAARIVSDLRQFSRLDPTHRWETADLGDCVRRTVRLARHLFGAGVRLEIDLADTPPLRVIRAEIDQVLLNLLSNAARAVAEAGRVRVSSRVVDTGGRPVVEIAVEDDGPGVPADLRHRIFEPFFTTRPEGQGVGLGLSLAFAIAERHGGSLRVDGSGARARHGARFVLSLPVSDAGAAAAAAQCAEGA